MRLAAVLLCACGTTKTTEPPKCEIVLTGDFVASTELDSCASVEHDDAGASALVIDTTTASVGRVRVSIDVSSVLAGGSLSADTTAAWDALELGLGDAGCAYQAGTDVVPHGSFALDWTNDGGTPHGDVDATLILHSPPGSSCSPSDVEYLHVTF
jgi:hypothetical protein